MPSAVTIGLLPEVPPRIDFPTEKRCWIIKRPKIRVAAKLAQREDRAAGYGDTRIREHHAECPCCGQSASRDRGCAFDHGEAGALGDVIQEQLVRWPARDVPGRTDGAERPRDGVDGPSELVLKLVARSPPFPPGLYLLRVVFVNGHQGHRLPLAESSNEMRTGRAENPPDGRAENRTRMCVCLQWWRVSRRWRLSEETRRVLHSDDTPDRCCAAVPSVARRRPNWTRGLARDDDQAGRCGLRASSSITRRTRALSRAFS